MNVEVLSCKRVTGWNGWVLKANFCTGMRLLLTAIRDDGIIDSSGAYGRNAGPVDVVIAPHLEYSPDRYTSRASNERHL